MTKLDPGAIEPREDSAANNSARLRALTRLVIGGVEISVDELLRRLSAWERDIARELEAEQAEEEIVGQTPSDSPSDLARLAIIGLIFELQDQVREGVSTLGRLQRWMQQLIDPFLWPLRVTGLLEPAKRTAERLQARGQIEVDRWIATGRQEETHSRRLADVAFDDLVDTYIEYLAANPEVQELVQSQGTGLANEVVEEVRERTVSADTFLEGLARSLLKRVPRAALPGPSPSVRALAVSLRPEKKGKRSTQ